MTEDEIKQRLEELEEKIKNSLHAISDFDYKMNQPQYTSRDIEIFKLNKKMEQEALSEYIQEKKQLIKLKTR